MLRFFRQIRQRLLTDNKISKYLLYAVGEILLVVIGILIALQIDNWNEERKNKLKEENYLLQLKDEFEANLMQTKGNLATFNKYQSLTELVLKVYSMDTIVDHRHLAMAVELASYGTPPVITDNVWQDLVSSGNSDLISNTKLRSSISKYFGMVEMQRNSHKDHWVDDQNATHDLTSSILPWQDRRSISMSFQKFISDSTLTYPEVTIDFESIRNKIREKPEFESKLFTMYLIQGVHKSMDKNQIKAIEDILEIIRKELIPGK